MASNDMSSWDENPDERVRQHWQEVFANFEVQADPALRQRILSPLASGQRYRFVRWLLAGCFLLASLPLADYDPRTTLSTGRIRATIPPEITALATKRPTDRSPIVRHPTPQEPTGLQDERVGRDLPIVTPPARPMYVGRSHPPIGPASHEVLVRRRGVYTPAKWPKSDRLGLLPAPPIPTGASSANAPVDGQPLLQPLGIKPLAHSFHALPAPPLGTITPPSGNTATTAIVHRPKRWFVDMVPQSSFQWMRASAATTDYLSQVSTPVAFSPTTWGYQLRGGLRINRWQANLLIGQLRSWARYTVSENRYRVEPSPTNPHELVRESYVVRENRLLPMIGAGLSQHQLLKQGRYSVELGGQVIYLPTSAQTLAALRGRAGRRILVKGGYEWSIGLSLDYGVNHILNEQQQLSIRPIVVGVGIQLQP